VCVEVEPWYTIQIGKNPLAKKAGLTIAGANQKSAQHIQERQAGNRVPAAANLPIPGRVLSGMNQNTNAQYRQAVNHFLNGRATGANSFSNGSRTSVAGPARVFEAIVARLKLWPHNQPVTYGFLQRDGLQSDVRDAFAEWQVYSCINFRETSSNVSSADIRISFVPGAGHYSLVGVDSGVPDFSPNSSGSFESLNLDPTGGDATYLVGAARHEVGHAVGFVHEHQNPINGINWNVPAVMQYFRQTQLWGDQKIIDNILTKLDDRTQYAATPRDSTSVMHYFFPASLVLGASTVPDRPNLDLSSTDKSFAAQQYGCSPGSTTTNSGGSTNTSPPSPPVITDRQKLKIENALALSVGTVVTGDFPADPQMRLYKLDLGGTGDDYVVETVDGATATASADIAMPVVIELFDGTDFSEAQAIKVSQFGALKNGSAAGSLGVQDAFLRSQLDGGKTYYALVRPLQRLAMGAGKSSYRLLLRKANAPRPNHIDAGSWQDLVDSLERLQKKLRK
jgi:hypothetical protein